MRPTDYFFAAIPSVFFAVSIAQIFPDMTLLNGIEKLGIVGILAAGILFFVRERRSFIAKSADRLEAVEKRLLGVENQVLMGNEKVVQLLGAQLEALREIREGQSENFSRMWEMTLSRLEAKAKRHKDKPPDPAQPVT